MRIFELEEMHNNFMNNPARIKIVGVGGGGSNAINSMIASNLQGVEFIAINTDAQALELSLAHQRVQIGNSLTKGLGSGARPEVGKEAAIEDRQLIEDALRGADMVFITAGMGGGTGTGASPIVAEIARELSILTTAVVTKPFIFEGRKRERNAEEGIKELRKYVDSMIVVQNQRLMNITDKETTWLQALNLANDVLRQAVKGISDLILIPGLINQDFADIRTILANSGRSLIGIGSASGENRAVAAAKMAITSPLLEETSIDGAKGVLININGGSSLSLYEVNEAASLVRDAVHDDAEIIFGSVIDPDLDEKIMVTVIATGFEEKPQPVMAGIDKWRPSSKDLHILKGTHRLLSKDTSSVTDESYLDVPTFMRKNGYEVVTEPKEMP